MGNNVLPSTAAEDFGLNKNLKNPKFNCRYFEIPLATDREKYQDLMRRIVDPEIKGITLLRRDQLVSERTGTFHIYVEWVEHDLETSNPIKSLQRINLEELTKGKYNEP